jgi:hypothetical protein
MPILRRRACAVPVALALALASGSVRADGTDTTLIGRLRVQGIYAHESPGVTFTDDYAIQGVPELSLVVLGKRSATRLTYTFAATAHSAIAGDISNRVSLVSAYEVDARTKAIFLADAGISTISNALLLAPPTSVPPGAVPLTNTRIASGHAAEETETELSPGVRFSQNADFLWVRGLDPPETEGYVASGIVTLERIYKRDALGVDLRGAYAGNKTPPIPPQHYIPLGATPRWRHDISPSWSSVVAAGVVAIVSPDGGARSAAEPLLQVLVDYTSETTTVELAGLSGPQANPLTGQLLEASSATLRVSQPLSVRHQVLASASVGYAHGHILELRPELPAQPDFDTILGDAGVVWSVNPRLDLFARWQLLDQMSPATRTDVIGPDSIRNAFIIGIQLATAPDPSLIPTRFGQRVDDADAVAAPGATADGEAEEAGPAPAGRPQPEQPDQPEGLPQKKDLPDAPAAPDPGGL